MDEQASEEQVQEIKQEAPVKKETIQIKIPKFLLGDSNRYKHDVLFGMTAGITFLFTTFGDFIFCLVALVAFFVAYGFHEKF